MSEESDPNAPEPAALSLDGDHPYSFDAEVKHDHGRIVVAPSGELDIATCEALERRIVPLLGRGNGAGPDSHVVVDLSGLLFIDVAGMRALLRCARLADERGVRLSIALGSDRVRRLFELCRMVDEFQFVYPSLAAVPN